MRNFSSTAALATLTRLKSILVLNPWSLGCLISIAIDIPSEGVAVRTNAQQIPLPIKIN
jgi:hypothetical protein